MKRNDLVTDRVYNTYPLCPVIVVRELFNYISRTRGECAIDDDEARAIIKNAVDGCVMIGKSIVRMSIMIDVHIQNNPCGVMLPFGIDASEYERVYTCKVSDILQPYIDSFKLEKFNAKSLVDWQDSKLEDMRGVDVR